MKILLNILMPVIVSTTSISPLINQNNLINQQTNNQVESEEFYWDGNNKSFEFVSEYPKNTSSRYTFVKTINIGKENLDSFSTVKLIDPYNESYSKTSWGSADYWGESLAKQIDNQSIELIFTLHRKINITDADDVSKNAPFQLLFTKQWSGIAFMESVHGIGFSEYSENEDNYIQIFGIQYVWTITTLSTGVMWTNIGRGIELFR